MSDQPCTDCLYRAAIRTEDGMRWCGHKFFKGWFAEHSEAQRCGGAGYLRREIEGPQPGEYQ